MAPDSERLLKCGFRNRIAAMTDTAESPAGAAHAPHPVPEPHEAPATTLEGELLRLLSRQSRLMAVPVFLGATLIYAVTRDDADSVWAALWLACVVVILVVRYYVLGHLPQWTSPSEAARLKIAVLLSGLNGLTHGAAVLFFPYLVEFERFIVFITILAFCAGSVSSTAGYRPVFLAYLVPTIGPLAATWLINPGAPIGWREIFVGSLTVLFGLVLVMLARDAFNLFRESFRMRTEQTELSGRLRQALEQSRVASAAKTRFLAAASHDLRQPVHSLALFSDSLSRQRLDERTKQIAEKIARNVDALSIELEALLDVSRLDAGAVEANVSSFDLNPMLARLLAQFSPLAEEKGLVIEMSSLEGATVKTDEMLLEQIVRNLLGNAVKYTDRGRISIRVNEAGGDAYSLELADTGRGIPSEAQQHIFEEFYQVDNAGRDRSRGLGLGLAITKRLVDLLELTLEFTSIVGEGTTFTLTLPRSTAARIRIEEKPPEVTFHELCVLVVDDEQDVLDGMKILLEGFGCEVELAMTTAEAVTLAKRRRPDVVLSDLRLRDTDDGLDTIHQLRALHRELPAILVTGDTAPERLRQASEAGVILLHKPVRPDKLASKINEACVSSQTTKNKDPVR